MGYSKYGLYQLRIKLSFIPIYPIQGFGLLINRTIPLSVITNAITFRNSLGAALTIQGAVAVTYMQLVIFK